ncbi:MAG: hypothetical protein ABH847_03810 [Candidatus Omnitrophota bacterium]
MLSNEEKQELLKVAKSAKIKADFRKLSKNRINPFIINGDVDMDLLVEFLTECNAFINHTPKPFRKIIDRDMRL